MTCHALSLWSGIKESKFVIGNAMLPTGMQEDKNVTDLFSNHGDQENLTHKQCKMFYCEASKFLLQTYYTEFSKFLLQLQQTDFFMI